MNMTEWCKKVRMSKNTAYSLLRESQDKLVNEIKKRLERQKQQSAD